MKMHWTTWLYIGMFGLVGALGGMQDAHAEKDPPGPEQIQSLYIIAVGLSGQGVPDKPPQVYRVSRATICTVLGASETCPAKGFQAADAVFYSNELDFTEALDSSILGHEFVHYLQYKKSGRAKNDLDKRQRECFAYKIQSEMLSKVGVNYYIPLEYRCNE